MSIQVSVVHGDALAVSVDVLVLKHAQSPYGVDRDAAGRLGLGRADLPKLGEKALVRSNRSIGAGAVLFLGVPPLHSFDYAEIRTFGRRAVREAAAVAPEAAEIALTLHGPGYGLDEIEAFNSELAGVLDAIMRNESGMALRAITFVEHNDGRVRRLQEVLRSAVPGGVLETGVVAESAGVESAAADRLSRVGYDSASKGHVFVAMPFSPDFEDVFAFGIMPAAHASNLLVERMDQASFTGDIVAHMQRRIAGASLFVADVTGANANVYLEIGFAWGNGIPTLLVCRDVDELQFDVRGHRCLSYTNIVELQKKLTREIAALLAK